MSSAYLVASDPIKLLNLCSTLHDKNSPAIQIKINKYLTEHTGSTLAFLVPLVTDQEDATVQVLGDTHLEQKLRFPIVGGLLKSVLESRSWASGCMDDLDPELQELLSKTSGPVLAVPVVHPIHHQVSLLVCLVGCTEDHESCSIIVLECLRFCLGSVLNTLALEEECRLKMQCQSLLTVARRLFSHLGDLSDLLKEIMTEARNLTRAERCSLFLLDPDHHELVAKVFDGEPSTAELRIARDQGIAGHVATTGQLLNIRDAYTHPLFYDGVDKVTGFRTRNILCFPIRDEEGIVGVAQLCNKKDGPRFTASDEEVALAFSIYCGISIMHSLVYKKIQDAQARSKLSNELLMYHMQVNCEDVEELLGCTRPHDEPLLVEWDFSPRLLPSDETVCYVLRMVDDLGLLNRFRINRDTLTRFTLFVRKGYRDTPYHNWGHAFSVAHFSYLLLTNLKLVQRRYLTELEALALFVSCLCHDLDHRGTTNSFQTLSGTTLASLYSSEGSVMERHHLAQTMCILNTDGCNILDGLSRDDYSLCLDLIRDLILATDLAQHLKLLGQQQALADEGYDPQTTQHTSLLLSLFMTVCDLSDQTKDWSVSKNIAEMVYREFFLQGDLEKSMGTRPLEMMDRDRARIPELQVQFLADIVLPVFSVLARLFPEAERLVEAVENNLQCWTRAVGVFKERCAQGHSPMAILTHSDLESRVLGTQSPP